MKTIKLNDKIVNMYQSWKELPLKNLQNFAPLMSNQEIQAVDRLFITIENITEPAISRAELEEFSFEDLSIITEWSKWALDFTKLAEDWDKKENGIVEFEIDGKKYAFDNTFQISMRQMLDLDHLTSERNTDAETHSRWFGRATDDRDLTDRKFWSNVHRIIAILVRPAKKRSFFKRVFYSTALRVVFKTSKKVISTNYIDSVLKFEVEKYNQSTIEDRAILFQNKLSASDGAMLAFFLSGLKKGYNQITQDLTQEQVELPKKNLVKNGVGIQQ